MDSKIIHGDSLIELKSFADNSIDAIITDPPYEIGFMTNKWDSSGIAFNVDFWKECYRVLKPGAYLISFCATRTYHRMTCAVEDAGFEIKDMINWVYSSGFPKSRNIGIDVDKILGNEREVVGVSNSGLHRGSIADYSPKNDDKHRPLITKGCSEWEGFGSSLKPAHETICLAQKTQNESLENFNDLFNKLLNKLIIELCQFHTFASIVKKNIKLNHHIQKGELNIVQFHVNENIVSKEYLRELMDIFPLVLTENMNWNIVSSWLNILVDLYNAKNTYTTSTELNMITELKILNSMEWGSIFQNIIHLNEIQKNGTNTNVLIAESVLNAVKLKLNYIQQHFVHENAISKEEKKVCVNKHEPMVMARKPLSENTIAENVLKHGTGALDIDSCRIPTTDSWSRKAGYTPAHEGYGNGAFTNKNEGEMSPLGRFPANVVVSDKALGDEKSRYFDIDVWAETHGILQIPKPASNERHKGFDETDELGMNKNIHPTVKPINLMSWLIRLISKEGDIVLDPFGGSGTTAVAAISQKRKYIIIEMTEKYIDVIKTRVNTQLIESKKLEKEKPLF
jgi:DNA modification methylase